MINNFLNEIGLSDKESRIYRSLLEISPATTRQVSDFTKINRITTHVLLTSLIGKGLVTFVKGNLGKKYEPADFNIITSKINIEIKKYLTITQNINLVINDLDLNSKHQHKKPQVLFFEGLEGIKNVCEDFLSIPKGTLIQSFSLPTAWDKISASYYKNIEYQRIKRGIYLQTIYPHSINLVRKSKTVSRQGLTRIAFLNSNDPTFASDLLIYQNKIALISVDLLFGIIIEDEEISETMRAIFDLAWDEVSKNKSE